MKRVAIRTQVVGPIFARVRAAGADGEALRGELGLAASATTDPETVIDLDLLERLYERAAELTNDRDFGLHLASNFPRGTYGIVEFIARSSPTVREGWRRIVELSALMNEQVRVSFEGGVLRHAVVGRPRGYGRHGNEFFVPAVLLQTRALVDAPFVPRRVWFAHEAPADASEHARLLGTDAITWSAAENGFEMPAEALDLPVCSADPPLRSTLEREAKRALASQPPPPRSIADQVRSRVREQLERGALSLDDAAAALHMSARTLQRRLAEDERTSFAKVVDEERQRLARAWVKDGRFGLSEIGFRLGYADLPAFVRAFRRWTGTTPARFRS